MNETEIQNAIQRETLIHLFNLTRTLRKYLLEDGDETRLEEAIERLCHEIDQSLLSISLP